ncbi:hypothetical protein Prudu_012909, partial [Prunus dulcis]
SSRIQRIVDRSPGYFELANPRSRILIKLYLVPRGPRRLLRRLHQWHSMLAPGGVIAASTTDTTSTDASVSQPAKKNTQGSCRQLKTAKVTRAAPTLELHSSLAHDIGHVVRSHCPMKWKSWKVMPDEIKTETNYNLEDLNDESLAYWKSDLHHYFEAFDDPQVALQEGCAKELEGREDSWAWLCAHFQAPAFVNKAKVNKGNKKKKTVLHHSEGGSKFPEIDVFGDVYVRPGNELAESLHTTMVERSQLVLQESASQLPPDTRSSLWILHRMLGFNLDGDIGSDSRERPGTYCRGMRNARRREPRPRSLVLSNSQVTALTAQVATLQSQM